MDLDKIVEETGSESEATYLVSPDETLATCLPASPSLSVINNKESSESDQNDNKIKTKGTLETAKEDAFVPHQCPCAEIPDDFKSKQQKSQQLTSTPPKVNSKTCLWSKDDTGTLNSDGNPLSNGQRTLSGNNTEPSKPDLLPTVNKSLIARQESIEPVQEDTTSNQHPKLSAIPDNTKEINSAHCVTSLVGAPSTKLDTFSTSTTENVSGLKTAKSETFQSVTDALEQEKHREEISPTPKKVLSIVLDLEPKDMQKNDNDGPDALRCSQGAELWDTKLTVVSITGPPEKKSGLCTTLVSPESDETDFTIHCLKSASKSSRVADSLPETPSALVNTELEEVKSTSAKLSCEEKSDACELIHNDVLNSSELCGSVAECQLTGAHAAETTFLHVKQEAMTDFCQAEEQTMSTVEGDALTETPIPASYCQYLPANKQLAIADTAQSTGTGNLVMAEGQNAEEPTEPERPESKPSKAPETQDKATLPEEDSELEVAASLEDTEMTQVHVIL